MIVVGVIGILESMFTTIFSSLPQPSVPGLNSLATTIVGSAFFGHLAWANNYFPLDTVLAASVVVWGAWVVLWVTRLVIYVLVKVHVLGGSDG